MKHKKFVVFLDVDGVFNTKTTVQRTPDGYTGIDDARVQLLANAIQKCGGADIILSSDWKSLRCTSADYMYLVSKLEMCGLSIAGKTKNSMNCKRDRGAEIIDYLEKHTEIEEYVILDDYTFDFENYKKLWERLLLTDGLERARFASQTPAVEALIFMDYLKLRSEI